MRDGVVRGDLDLARREAGILANLRVEQRKLPGWDQNIEAMKTAAVQVADAKDLDAASRSLAHVARTCGQCHATLFHSPILTKEPPEDRAEVVPVMKRHQWAAVRLWYGLIFPSSDAWSAGALALAGAPLDPGLLTPGQSPVPRLVELERSTHELAAQAGSAVSAADREQVFGAIVRTCSACHLRLGGGPSGVSASAL